MDLGREICTPNKPLCNTCPVSIYCNAYVNNDVDKYPIRMKKRSYPHYRVAVGIILKNSQILISKRKANGLLGGLWEFPGGKIKMGESDQECIVREVLEELNVLVFPNFYYLSMGFWCCVLGYMLGFKKYYCFGLLLNLDLVTRT